MINITVEEHLAGFLKCIGEPNRLLIIKFLTKGEQCVNDIIEATGREQSLVSHHLKALRKCGIVVSEQRAQKIYYRLSDPRIAELVGSTEALLRSLPLCQDESNCYSDKK